MVGYSIVKIDLHEDGKEFTATFKTGGQATFKIKDVVKQSHEKEMVQTFEEGFMYPIQLDNSKSTFYIYGSS